jgi:hypothetical protein
VKFVAHCILLSSTETERSVFGRNRFELIVEFSKLEKEWRGKEGPRCSKSVSKNIEKSI